jgi:tetratricopeptide (TPR) repeat protein
LPIHWDTQASGGEEIKELVDEHLIEHGQRQRKPVPTRISKQVASSLFTKVTEESAEESPRRLTFADFADLFERETMEQVPAGTRGAARIHRSDTPHASLQTGAPEFLELVEGTLLSAVVPRTDLVQRIRERTDHLTLSTLIGSSGMGKSTLAKLSGEEGGWYLINFQGKDSGQIQRLLNQATLRLADVPDRSTVLLDNLNFEGSAEEYVVALRKLIAAAREQAIHIVVTTQNPIPSRIKALVRTDPEEVGMSVPPFDEKEVKILLEEYGCPEAIREVWSTATMAQTSGHPQLADAYVAAASQPHWEEPSEEGLFEDPEPIEQVKKEARQKLRRRLPDNSFLLARRLSLLSHPFTREQALKIAEIPPPIPTAGADFDFLAGPWIEPLPENRYRVSPLLTNLYSDTLSEDEQHTLRYEVANALVEATREQSSITTYELNEILSHGLLSQNEAALAVAASACNNFENWSEVAPHIEWFAAVKTGGAQGILIESSPGLSSQLRLIQFRIAVPTNQSVIPILDAWESELNALGESHPLRDALEVARGTAVLSHPQADVPVERAFRLARPVVEVDLPVGDKPDVESDLKKAVEEARETGDRSKVQELQAAGLLSELSSELTPSQVAEILSYHAGKAGEVVEFVELALGDTTSLGSVLIGALEKNIPLTNGLTSRPWLRMAEQDDADWDVVLGAFDRLVELAEENGLDALLVATGRNQAIVYHEYLEDEDKAAEVLSEAEETAGPHPLLESYWAKMRNMEGDYEGALDILEDTLSGWEPTSPTTPKTHIFHDAIEAAGNLGRWDRAAYWAQRGQESAKLLSEASGPYVELCYAVDEAFLTYKDGDTCEALELLVDSISRLPPPTNPRIRMLYRRAAHVTVWFQQDLGGLELSDIQEPSPGLASHFEADSEEMEADVMEKEALFSILDESAELAGCSELEIDSSHAAEAENVMTQSMGTMREINQGIRTAAEDLLDRYLALVKTARVRMAAEGQLSTFDETEIQDFLHLLTYGAINEISSEKPDSSILDEWWNRLEEIVPDVSSASSWFEVARDAFSAAKGDRRVSVELTQLLQDSHAHPDERLVAAAALGRVSDDEHVRLLSLAILVTTVAREPYGVATNEAAASLAGVDAKRGNGVQETARVVVESEKFETLNLDDDFVETLHKIAGGEIDWGMPRASIQ